VVLTPGAVSLPQRPPSALTLTIEADVERYKRSVEAQCLCQRPPSGAQSFRQSLEIRTVTLR
jgi:hypothetical protein